MLRNNHLAGIFVVFCALFLACCSLLNESDRKGSNTGLIVTPIASYSTLKSRNLAQKYNGDLEHVVVEVVRNPTTGKLQFANNISSAGGIGFFTHSASKAVDERYLELILAVPEVFDEGTGLNPKIDRLLSQYGAELLRILLRDAAIYDDPEVAGYGLNFFWRNLVQSQTGSQIVFERAVLYFKKDEARNFLDDKVTKERLLSDAVIFAMRGDAPAQQVTYTSREIASAPNVMGREEKSAESAVAALKAEVTEKDISTEKESQLSEKERKPSSQPIAGRGTEAPAAPRSDKAGKEAEGPDSLAEKPARETPAKAEVAIAKEETRLPQTTGGVRESSAQPSGPKEAASAARSSVTEPQTVMPPPETTHKESSETAYNPPKIERFQEVEKRSSQDIRPPLANPGKPHTLETPEQRQVEKSTNAAVSQGTTAEAKPEKIVPEVRAPETGTVKEKPAQTPEPAALEKHAEQPASTIATQKTESLQEATLRGDSSQEVARQTTEDVGSSQGGLQKSTESSAEKSVARERVEERTKETPAQAVGTTEKQPDNLEAKGPTSQTGTEVRVALKSVEGYVIQISFPQKTDALRWSETLSREGYTTSITSIGEANSVRLRVGSFASPDTAKNLLGRLQKQGLHGLVIQVPKG